ncbi:hypothetical protein SAMN05443662_1680 [Sulfurivirga caldicuralii]|uniref:Uncharacterized protein n=1 Tax=Sulfurivirga caldicuralii TaxID=364032 RepID=A0A1N6HGL8_9GAMM|nr:hypothetical protein [Sulfurivirga caldicuralii]SIO18920.1 hypothetical protein SAMN05443662_1680 [Sulfurivirga caldicuralii]
MIDVEGVLARLQAQGFDETIVQTYILENQNNPTVLMQGAAQAGLSKDEIMTLAAHYGVTMNVTPSDLLAYLSVFNISQNDVKTFLMDHISSPQVAYSLAAQFGFSAADVGALASYMGLDYSNTDAQTVLANLEQIGIPESEVYNYLQAYSSTPDVIYLQAASLGLTQVQVNNLAEALGVNLEAGTTVQLAGVPSGDSGEHLEAETTTTVQLAGVASSDSGDSGDMMM